MKLYKPLIILTLTGVSAFAVKSQVSASPERFSPQAEGYMERARAMSDAGNYAGVIDQLMHLDTQRIGLTPAQTEEYTYLLAEACYHRDDADCLRLLRSFLSTYPASPLAPKVSMMIGDFYFYRHEWADALDAYDKCDSARLNRDAKAEYNYRRMLCLIKTGHFSEATGVLAKLRDVAGYENAYNFYRAYLDYIDGRFDQAYQRFSKVPEGIKGLDAGYYMAQIEYSRGEYESVIRRGTTLLRRNPDPELAPELDRIVGLSYFKLGNYQSAAGYLTDYLATTAASPEADALYAMGAIEYGDGRYNAARQRFGELTDRADELGQGAWLYLGQCYLQQNNPSSAALAFEKAYRMAYDKEVSETALYNYVTALTRGGKVPFSSSSALLEEFVDKYPDSQYTPEVEAYLATSYYNDRNYLKALQYIESIKRPSSEILGAKQKILYELGIELLSNGNAAESVDYLRQCVALSQYDRELGAQASLWLGDALFSLGRYKEAMQSYQAFVNAGRSQDNRALGLYDLAYAQYKLGDYKTAAVNFQSALTTRPALEERLINDARIRMGDCLYYTGQYAKAREAFTAAIDAGANDADYALYRRSILYGLEGNRQAKIADLNRAEREYPQSRWLSKILLEEAVAYEEAGQSGLAADAYKKRLSVAENIDLDELLRMAAAMNRASQWENLLDVVDRIRHAGGLEPDELAEIDLYEADALAGLGQNKEAVLIYTRLADNPSSLPGSKAIVSIAEIDLKNRDYEAARSRMEEFTDLGTPHQYWLARGFIALADAYRGLGQTGLAREYIISLQDNYPGNESDIKNMISTRLSSWR